MFDYLLIDEAADLICGSTRLVAFSGAGVSEESGIPTFRDPGGLWDRYDVDVISGGGFFGGLLSGRGAPDDAISFIREFLSFFEGASPNPGHLALRELEEMGTLRSVITQNIDNLHNESGNTRVIEVHGNVCRLACLSCSGKVLLTRDELLAMGNRLAGLLEKEDLAGVLELLSRCACGGVCTLDVVGFGEPVQDMRKAESEARGADVMLILGTSGVVYPAAALPRIAKQSGARLIEINATGICFPGLVDLGITGKTGEVLPLIVERVRALRGP